MKKIDSKNSQSGRLALNKETIKRLRITSGIRTGSVDPTESCKGCHPSTKIDKSYYSVQEQG